MPIYDYKCDTCANEFEVRQRITEPAGADCPKCGENKVRRLISNTSFQLKGSGWYVTDYAKRSGGGSASSATSKPSTTDGDSAGSSDKTSPASSCASSEACPMKSECAKAKA